MLFEINEHLQLILIKIFCYLCVFLKMEENIVFKTEAYHKPVMENGNSLITIVRCNIELGEHLKLPKRSRKTNIYKIVSYS